MTEEVLPTCLGSVPDPREGGTLGTMQRVKIDLSSFSWSQIGPRKCLVVNMKFPDGQWHGGRVELLHDLSEPKLYQAYLKTFRAAERCKAAGHKPTHHFNTQTLCWECLRRLPA